MPLRSCLKQQAAHAQPFRFRLRRRDSSPIWADIQGAALQTANRQVYAISATVSSAEPTKTLSPKGSFLGTEESERITFAGFADASYQSSVEQLLQCALSGRPPVKSS